MNGLEFLDLVIGLIFIYLIFSIASSTLWELFVNFTNLRGKMLRNWIFDNFSNFNYADDQQKEHNEILEHPIIKSLSKERKSYPVYISSKLFSDVLIDLLLKKELESNSSGKMVDIKMVEKRIKDIVILVPVLRSIFLQYLGEKSRSLEKLKEKIERWYDETQEALIGSYKKNLQRWIFAISAVLVVSTNTDTIKLASYLYNNDNARETLAAKASLFVQDSAIIRLISRIDTLTIDSAANRSQTEIVHQLKKDVKILNDLQIELKENAIPVGWNNEDFHTYNFLDYIKKLVGLLLTALAVSMGSPFWFDILSKLANLRSSGNKPKSSLDEIDPKSLRGKEEAKAS
jgi:hypothetical protein